VIVTVLSGRSMRPTPANSDPTISNSQFKQPCLIARILDVGPGLALVLFPSLTNVRGWSAGRRLGAGAPRGEGLTLRRERTDGAFPLRLHQAIF
jgi:hypothetical protein